MKITLSDTERQYIALFEDVTGATARDCLVFDGEDDRDNRDDRDERTDGTDGTDGNGRTDRTGRTGGRDGDDASDGDGRDRNRNRDRGRVVFLVAAGEMGQAIGPDGRTVRQVEERLGREVELVEDADTPESFVASALAPAAVRHVTVSEQGDRVAYVEVPEDDRGVAIGRGGRNIETARELARRRHDIDDIQLT